jgi:D-glycero-alpha-D-manno-heptose-7-phosphate kinase
VVEPGRHWGKHPLIEATLELMRVPTDLSIEVSIFSHAPSGASTGTSAALTVALIAALDQLAGGRMSPQDIAVAAHRVETELLHQQSGIQDQLCAAYGGVNFIEMGAYPHAVVSPLTISPALAHELERRLVLIYLGRSHHSSQIHETVIQALTDAGPNCQPLNDLRRTAERSRDALLAADMGALGAAMIENTEAQARLHASLVSGEAQQVIEVARAHGAVGWKVNGAGGAGGSITLLGGDDAGAQREMMRQIARADSLYQNIPIHLSREGVCAWRVQNNTVCD